MLNEEPQPNDAMSQTGQRRAYAWLPALIGGMVVVALLVGAMTWRYLEGQLVATKGEGLALAAVSSVETLNRLMAERYGDVQMMAQVVAVRNQEPHAVSRYFEQHRAAYPVYLWIGMTDRHGRILASTQPSSVGLDRSAQPWFQAVLARPALFMAAAAPSLEKDGTLAVTISAPITDKAGLFDGVVVAQVGLPVLEQVIAQEALMLQSQVGQSQTIEWQIVGRAGEVLVDSRLRREGQTNLQQLGLPSAALVVSAPPGYVQERHSRRNVEVVTGYARTKSTDGFPELGWAVLVRMDYADIVMPIRVILWKLAAAGLLIGAPLLGLLFWATGSLWKEYLRAQEERAWAKAAELKRLRIENKFQDLFEFSPDAIIMVGADGGIALANRQAEFLFGYSREEFQGLPVETLMPETYRQGHEGLRRQFFAAATPRAMGAGEAELRAQRKDGTIFSIDISLSPIHTEEGILVAAAVRDITERKHIEESLKQSVERFNLAVQGSQDGLWDIHLGAGDPFNAKNPLYYSPRMKEIMGAEGEDQADVLGTWLTLLHPDDRERIFAALTAHLTQRVPYDIEYRIVKKAGDCRWIAARGQAQWNEAGIPVRMSGSFSDITDRKRMEKTLRSVNEELELRVARRTQELVAANGALSVARAWQRDLIDAITGIVWECDARTWRFTFVSSYVEALLDYPAQRWIEEPDFWQNHVHPDDREWVLAYCLTASREQRKYSFEYRMVAADGRTIWLQDIVTVEDDDEGPAILRGIMVDVTERKRTEAALAASEQKFRLLAESAIDMIYRLNEHGQIVYMSPASEKILGYAPQEMIGAHFSEYFSASELPLVVKAFKGVMAGETVPSLQLSLTAKDGRLVPTEVNVGPIYEAEVVIGLYGIIRDITERKQMEAMLRQSHAELERRVFARTAELAAVNFSLQVEVAERKWTEEALEKKKCDLLTAQAQAHLGSWSWDIRTGANLWSDENYRIFGFEPESIQPSYEIFSGALYGEDRERVLRAAQAAIEAGAHYDIECRIVRPGGEIRHVHSLGDVTRDDKGQPLRMAGTVLDITERKRLEEQLVRHNEELERRVAERTARVRELESQRAQTEKLAALGQLAAGVAHEINNPIAGIKNAFLVVKQAIPKDFAQYHFVGMIEREINRVSHIVKQMYQLYRAGPRRPQAVDLAVVCHDLTVLVTHRLAQRHLSLHIDMDASVPRLHLPPGDLLQVLLNLLNNAIDSSPERAAITLRVREESQAVCIGVIDQGTGIPPEVLARIFEPFFTTKVTGPSAGMGLGLSVSHSLVQAMGGTIEVQTRVHEGTTLTVVLPVSTGSVEPNSLPQPLEEVSTHDR